MKIKDLLLLQGGGSKEIKNKNIIKIKGKPLISYSIDFAKNLKITNIFVSTDSKKIKTIAKKNGTIIINRPRSLATDKSPEIYSWKHAISWYEEKFKKNLKFLYPCPLHLL